METYLNAVQPRSLVSLLRTQRHTSLQQMIASAFELEADLKPQRSVHQTWGQNPERHRCPKCNRWKNIKDTCTACQPGNST